MHQPHHDDLPINLLEDLLAERGEPAAATGAAPLVLVEVIDDLDRRQMREIPAPWPRRSRPLPTPLLTTAGPITSIRPSIRRPTTRTFLRGIPEHHPLQRRQLTGHLLQPCPQFLVVGSGFLQRLAQPNIGRHNVGESRFAPLDPRLPGHRISCNKPFLG